VKIEYLIVYLKFGRYIVRRKSYPKDDKPSLKEAWSGRDPF